MSLPNLYNMCDGKTKATITFIQELEIKQYWNPKAQRHFIDKIEEALELPTANKMLQFIGYRPSGKVGLYSGCNRINMEKQKHGIRN